MDMIQNIDISEVLERDGRLIEWAERVFNKQTLTDEDKAISATVNGYVASVWKLGKREAKENIAEFILKVVEPEVYNTPDEILENLFTSASYGEFDKIRIMNNPKNTLIAQETAARTGNSDKSYIDFTLGQVVEKHLQLEFEIKMADLRRDGAFTLATYIMFALDELRNKKFQVILGYVDSLIRGGDNLVESASALTLQAVREFTDKLDDNCLEGIPTAVALSSMVRDAMRVSGVQETMSDSVKDQIFRNGEGSVKHFSGTDFATIKPCKKTGKGETLVPKNVMYGFCGKVGEMYTKGEMRVSDIVDGKTDFIEFKLTGIEFGMCIKDLSKVYKLVVTQ